MSRIYIIDTNFFIQAHRVSYPLDVAESFWDKVRNLASTGTMVSIDKVKSEIYKNDDALKEWCDTNLENNFWHDTSDIVNNEYKQLVNWAVSKDDRYTPAAINEFLESNNADAFIIAFTLVDKENRIIVTSEITSNAKNKIKIPDVCSDYGIKFLKPMEMFRELNEKF